jgi:1-deoxyxylulose-5-phosphate synthase
VMCEYRSLGRSGLVVSSIGLGCVTFGREIDEPTSRGVLDHAFEQGLTLLDTASAYGEERASERVLGRWLRDRGMRDEVVLCTKITPPLTRDGVLDSVDESLMHLKTDRIDLLQIHAWDETNDAGEWLGALDEVVQAGKARALGCSNVTLPQLETALEIQTGLGGRMESVQPIYNLVHRELESGLLPLCVEEEIGVMTYSPLGAGFLTGKYQLGGPIPPGTRFDIKPGHQPIYFSPHGWRVLAELHDESVETGISMVQLALRWAFSRSGVTSVLVGCRTPAHVDQALTAHRATRGG